VSTKFLIRVYRHRAIFRIPVHFVPRSARNKLFLPAPRFPASAPLLASPAPSLSNHPPCQPRISASIILLLALTDVPDGSGGPAGSPTQTQRSSPDPGLTAALGPTGITKKSTHHITTQRSLGSARNASARIASARIASPPTSFSLSEMRNTIQGLAGNRWQPWRRGLVLISEITSISWGFNEKAWAVFEMARISFCISTLLSWAAQPSEAIVERNTGRLTTKPKITANLSPRRKRYQAWQ